MILNHINLAVSDVQAARGFLMKHFGFHLHFFGDFTEKGPIQLYFENWKKRWSCLRSPQ